MPTVVNVPGFIGGSNKSDVMMDSPELLLNMFVEKTEAAENRGYTNKRLRSVEGERSVLEFPFDTKIGCRGMFTASDGSVFAAFNNSVYRITQKYDGSLEYVDILTKSDTRIEIQGKLSKIVFAETGGVDSNIIWVDGSEYVYAYSLNNDTIKYYRTPLRVYKNVDGGSRFDESHAEPSHVVCLSGVICINDVGNDTWYYTDPYVLGGTTSKRIVYKLDAKGNVVYKDASKIEVDTKEVEISDEASNGVAYLWLDRYSLPKFQTAEYVADKITSMVLSNDRIFCFGEKSLQIYSLTETSDAYGNSYSVFSSTGNNTRDNGSEFGSTVATLGGNVFWLGSSTIGEHSVWISNGGVPTRISSNVIERELRSFVNISDSYGFAYAYNGHQFYVLTIPSANKTFCYDASTNEWFNRSTRDMNAGKNRHWFPAFAVSAFGNIYLGSYSAQFLVQIDANKFTDYKDDPIIKQRVSPVFVKDFEPFRLDAFWMEWGVGLSSDVELNPVAMLEASADGGNTYGDEAWGNGGNIGQYFWRTEWRRCFPICSDGELPRMYVVRVTISDPVKVVITGAKMQYSSSRRR